MSEEEMQNRINQLETEIQELKKQKTIISLKEYHDLIDGLETYNKIPELNPITEMMKREIDKLTVWI